MVASRWPWRFCRAAAMIASISCSVRYSRVRSALFFARFGITVRFSMAGLTNWTCAFRMKTALFNYSLFGERLIYEQSLHAAHGVAVRGIARRERAARRSIRQTSGLARPPEPTAGRAERLRVHVVGEEHLDARAGARVD